MSEVRESTRLFDQARRKQEQATRCRSILKSLDPFTPAADLIKAYAMELEEAAKMLESLADEMRGRQSHRRVPLARV